MAENKSSGPCELRDAFGQTLLELGGEEARLVFLDGDLHTSTKASMFREAFPGRFYQFGIAEQNLFGAAAGLALEGFIAMPSTFASFVARRALDQIAISIAYPKLNVKIPGSYAGVPTSRAGASHNSVEDLAVMRALPNMLVADPGSCRDLAAVMRAAVAVQGPVYFRVARYTIPEFLPAGYSFEWGKGSLLREGSDVSLFGTGIMTFLCLKAADILARRGIKAEVVHMPSIKPLDAELALASANKTGCAVSAENASVLGGLGGALAELLSERRPVPLLRVGVLDSFVESGGVWELLGLHKMLPQDIAKAAARAIELKGGRR